MSSAYLLKTSRATRLDASQGAEALPSVLFDNAQKIVYPSLYPLPGSSHPPLFSPPNATLATPPSLATGTYSAGVAYYATNYQSHNTICSQAGSMPPMENPALPMNNTDLRATHYPFHDIPAGNAISTTAPLASVDTGHYVQSPSFISQATLPTQPEAGLDLWQVQPVQHHQQAAQEDLAVAAPPREPENVHIGDYHIDQEPHAAPVAPDARLCSDQSNNQVHPPEQNTTVHTCSNNPDIGCSGRGVICLDALFAYIAKFPDMLSPGQIADYVIEAIAPSGPNGGQSAGQSSQVDTTNPAPSQHGQMGRGVASPVSNTTVSASTSGHSSPSGSFVHPPSRSATASSSRGSTSRPVAKRRRSEGHLGDRLNEQRRQECTDAQGSLDHDGDPCVGNNQILDCSENPRKKKRSPDNVEYICRICLILGRPCPPLSRRDSLKRHILSLHAIFEILFGHEKFDLLKPRQKVQNEDLGPLIATCISLQLEAQRLGAEIKPGHDLAAVYPHIAASLTRS